MTLTLRSSNVLRRCFSSCSCYQLSLFSGSRCALAVVSHKRPQLSRASTSSRAQFQPPLQLSRLFSGSQICSRMAPVGQEGTAAQLVDSTIAENAVAIFSKSYCPFCTKVKEYFKDKKIAFKALELDTMGNLGSEIQALLLERTGQSTVPSVWVNGKFIGEFPFSFHHLREFQILALIAILYSA